jgi:chromosome segregation ATPase
MCVAVGRVAGQLREMLRAMSQEKERIEQQLVEAESQKDNLAATLQKERQSIRPDTVSHQTRSAEGELIRSEDDAVDSDDRKHRNGQDTEDQRGEDEPRENTPQSQLLQKQLTVTQERAEALEVGLAAAEERLQAKEQEVLAAEARTARLEEQVTTLEAASLETAQKHADEIAELVRPPQITSWNSAPRFSCFS